MFKDVTLEFKGKQYTVVAKKLLPLIAEIEEVLTITEICSSAFKRAPKLMKLSEAFAIALRHAGASTVTTGEVYKEIFKTKTSISHVVTSAIAGLLTLMIPPEIAEESKDDEEVEVKKN